MADHYLKTLELLEELDDLEQELLTETRSRNDRATVGELHGRIGRTMKRADVHAKLALRQELQEVATGLQLQGVRL